MEKVKSAYILSSSIVSYEYRMAMCGFIARLPPPARIGANKTEDVCCGLDLEESHGLMKTKLGYNLSLDPKRLSACNNFDDVA